jgi:hypothetical protein
MGEVGWRLVELLQLIEKLVEIIIPTSQMNIIGQNNPLLYLTCPDVKHSVRGFTVDSPVVKLFLTSCNSTRL